MIFTSQTPLSQYYVPPDYVDNPADRAKMAWAGYKPSGEQSTWGKISSWIPGVNLLQNKAAEKASRGSEDAMQNVQEDFQNRITKTAVGLGIVGAGLGGLGALGVIGGAGSGAFGTFVGANSQALMQGGLNLATKFGGQLAFDQNDLVTEGQAIYR